VIAPFIHAWERRLASENPHRFVRPFEWGLEWIGLSPNGHNPLPDLQAWARGIVANSESYYSAPPTTAYSLHGDRLTFPSAVTTPDVVNNTVHARLFPARNGAARSRRAVVVLPQWNADPGGHVALCRALARFGVTALRLTLPYHDERRPTGHLRADYIVSSNVGRTAQVNRQAVLDVRRSIDWLEGEGYDRVGILGTSLGSCLSMLAMTHDRRIRAGVFNHVSPYFADVVWRGVSTSHVRAGLDGHIALDALRECWMPISPWPFIERLDGRPIRLIYARYDLTFPVDLSRRFIEEFRERRVAADVIEMPCGHYSIGRVPFKFFDGYYLVRYLLEHV
jgi:hypothetical protein